MPLKNKKAVSQTEKDELSLVKKVKSWKKEAWKTFILDIDKYLESCNDQLHATTAISSILRNNGASIQDSPIHSCTLQQASILQQYTKLYSPKSRQYEEAMLHLLATGFGHDVTLKVGDVKFLSHRGILAARCEYFASMFSYWTEKEKNEIILEGVEPAAFGMFLCYTYGLFIDFSKVENISIPSLASVADMYNSVYINHAVELYLVKEKCHIFHKPCAECLVGFAESLKLACAYNLLDLKKQCLDWSFEHLHKVWHTEAFCTLPSEVMKICYSSVIDKMDIKNVGDVTLRVDILLGGLTSVKWEKPMVAMATKLMGDCEEFIARHLYQITEGGEWDLLFKGMGCRTEIVERILGVIGYDVTSENACHQFVAVKKLLVSAKTEDWNPNTPALQKLFDKLERYLSSSYFAIIHTEGWKVLPDEVKLNLGMSTMSGADPARKPSRKPVLSSSKLQTTKKSLKKAPIEKVSSKTNVQRKKKSVQTNPTSTTPPPHLPCPQEPPPPPRTPLNVTETLYDVIGKRNVTSTWNYFSVST